MKLLSSFFLIFLISCTSHPAGQPEAETVKYEKATTYSLREFIESIKVIKLHHQNSITVSSHNIIRQADSSFYLGDIGGTQIIYRFNKDGTFLDSIGKVGKGPEEYLHLHDFYVDSKSNEILVASYPDFRLFCFGKNGNFKSLRKAKYFANSFIKTGDRFWLHAGHNNGYQPERILALDTNLNLVGKYLPLKTKAMPASIGPVFKQWQNEVYLMMVLNPTVYQIVGDSITPFIHFDYGDYNIPESYWRTPDPMQAFNDICNKGFMNIRSFMTNGKYIIAEHSSQKGDHTTESYYYCSIKNLNTGKWDWIRQKDETEVLIVNGQQPPEMTSRPEWYAAKMRGFTQDGQLMVFVLAHELDKLTPEDKALISNPEILENTDPDIDMFVFLVQLKNN